MGMVVIHAINHEPNQFSKKANVPQKGVLATPEAMADVMPD